jgi:hypothetical protein
MNFYRLAITLAATVLAVLLFWTTGMYLVKLLNRIWSLRPPKYHVVPLEPRPPRWQEEFFPGVAPLEKTSPEDKITPLSNPNKDYIIAPEGIKRA